MNINTKELLIADNNYMLCETMFKLLSCNLLWMININNTLKIKNKDVNILVSDRHLLDYYLEKKYYVTDPNISIQLPISNETHKTKNEWLTTIGTDQAEFNKNGFLYDLYKMFHIDEFISIEKMVGKEYYCFRFFTKNNRFVFMNKLLNNMPIIKYSINKMIESFNFSRI